MEQRFPRIGMAALAVSATQFLGVLLNGLLGWFPAGIIGEGDRGDKFHLLQYLRQALDLPYKENGFWSDAGPLTGQEYAMILIMLVTLGIGLVGIRQRPAISGPDSMSSDEQRARLDEQSVGVGRPGGLSVINPTTASIVESVLGKSEVPTVQVISDALGEMTAVAMEMGVDEELIKGTIVQMNAEEQAIYDSQYTVTEDEDEMDIVDLTDADSPTPTTETVAAETVAAETVTTETVAAETVAAETVTTDEADGGFADDWLDGDDWLDDTPSVSPAPKAVAEEAKPEPVPAPAPVTVTTTPVTPPTTHLESEYLRPTAPRDAASGSMPVRPQALPDAAEYDIRDECWTLYGRQITFTETPPPPPAEVAKVEVTTVTTAQPQGVVAPPPQAMEPPGPRRLPTVPQPPPKKGGKKLPALPSLPNR